MKVIYIFILLMIQLGEVFSCSPFCQNIPLKQLFRPTRFVIFSSTKPGNFVSSEDTLKDNAPKELKKSRFIKRKLPTNGDNMETSESSSIFEKSFPNSCTQTFFSTPLPSADFVRIFPLDSDSDRYALPELSVTSAPNVNLGEKPAKKNEGNFNSFIKRVGSLQSTIHKCAGQSPSLHAKLLTFLNVANNTRPEQVSLGAVKKCLEKHKIQNSANDIEILLNTFLEELTKQQTTTQSGLLSSLEFNPLDFYKKRNSRLNEEQIVHNNSVSNIHFNYNETEINSLQQFPNSSVPFRQAKTKEPSVPPSSSQQKFEEQTFFESDFIHFLPLSRFRSYFGKYVILDTEATGLGTGHALTEIGCVEVRNFEKTGLMFRRLINPERSISYPAYKLTGYTLSFLSKHSVFEDVMQSFLDFIKDSTLVMHYVNYDLRLINESLKKCRSTYGNLEEKHIVVDSLPFARTLHPGQKNDLTNLCERYKIDTWHIQRHSALGDAECLADVFCAMVRNNNSALPLQIMENNEPPIEFYNQFPEVKGTNCEKYFNKMGIKHDLPSSFRFVKNMYHPQLCTNYPALLVYFSKKKGAVDGVFVKYFIEQENWLKSQQEKQELNCLNKHFYGTTEGTFTYIHQQESKRIFVGNVMNALIAREALLGNSSKEICKSLNIDKGDFSIKACLDISFLKSIEFNQSIHEIFILLDHKNKKDLDSTRTLPLHETPCLLNQSSNLLDSVRQETSLTGYNIQQQQGWTIASDKIQNNKRCLELDTKSNQHSIITVCEDRAVTMDNTSIQNPKNSIFVFSQHRVKIKAIFLKDEEDDSIPIEQIAEKSFEKIVSRMCKAIPLPM